MLGPLDIDGVGGRIRKARGEIRQQYRVFYAALKVCSFIFRITRGF